MEKCLANDRLYIGFYTPVLQKVQINVVGSLLYGYYYYFFF